MGKINQVGDLEIDDDMRFQRAEWKVERIGWFLMLIVAVLALVGLFGQGGPVSNNTSGGEQFRILYDPFQRLFAPTQFQFQIDPQLIKNDEIRMTIDRTLLDNYTINRIVPQPENEEVAEDHITYVFKTSNAAQKVVVTIDMESNLIGIVRGEVGIENGPAQQMMMFIYP